MSWASRKALGLWHFQAKVGAQHSSRKKQTASQYLLSLPNLQHVVGNGEKAVGLPDTGGSITPLSLWSGGDRRGRYVRVPGLGHVLALEVSSSLCLSQPQTITDSQLQLCSSPEPVSSSLCEACSLLLFCPHTAALF